VLVCILADSLLLLSLSYAASSIVHIPALFSFKQIVFQLVWSMNMIPFCPLIQRVWLTCAVVTSFGQSDIMTFDDRRRTSFLIV
jgi:hypothetical protein